VAKLGSWLNRQPLWLYAIIVYAAGFGGWTGAVYLDAWRIERQAGHAALPQGQFSVLDPLINGAVLMVLVVSMEWQRRARQARKSTSSANPTDLTVNQS
jgi:hypothetical protein